MSERSSLLLRLIFSLSIVAFVLGAFFSIDIYRGYAQFHRGGRSEGAGYHVPHPVLGWIPTPGAVVSHVEEGSFAVEYRMDANGFKAVDHRGSPQWSLYILGDSYSFGHGVSNDDTYANLIAAEYLRDDVHVFNLSAMSYGIVHMYGRFLENLDRLRPGDLVVFAPTSQDLRRNLTDFHNASYRVYPRRPDRRYPAFRNGVVEGVSVDTARNRRLALLFNAPLSGGFFRLLHGTVSGSETTGEAREMMSLARRHAEERGARFALFFLPQPKECGRGRYQEDVSSFTYFDVMDYFPKDAEGLASVRFPTDAHWSPVGHEIAARAIVETLVRAGLIPRESLRPMAAQRIGQGGGVAAQ